MFGVALIFYLFFLLGYGAFLWAVLWHLRAYCIAQGGNEHVSTIIVASISLLLVASLLLFLRVPWQSYSLTPSFLP